MSSAQEPHLLPHPKPKLSPLELRNTDLVSRLLAATPPYLYNMSLLPNTYFFSEMLRSFVQAKNEQRGNVGAAFGGNNNNNMFYGHQMRRSRKRGWNQGVRESYPQSSVSVEEKVEKSAEKNEHNEPWMIKSMRKNDESALELTTNTSTSNITTHQKIEEHQHQKPTTKIEETTPPFTHQPTETNSNLVLPPPPPIWYPPLYPTPPYGIDPLHFFIDLRVSGHIYDRQNGNQSKEATVNNQETIVSEKDSAQQMEKKDIKVEETATHNIFNQKRHCSAFSVPNSNRGGAQKNQTKFDVKSMGFDKSSNKTSTNYVMSHINSIYKNLADKRQEAPEEAMTVDVDSDEQAHKAIIEKVETEKQKKVKDLRALIGLELVVDYMSHKKGMVRSNESSVISEEEEMSSEIESCESPPLEVVAIQDEA